MIYYWPELISWCAIAIGVVSTIMATKRAPDSFYSDTPWLLPFGIYVWGDALVLGPMWLGLGIVFFFLSPVEIIRVLTGVYGVRSAYEVVYWINHQVANRSYLPPLFRQVKWIGPEEAAILYQLIHTVQIIAAVVILMLTFR